MAFLSLSGISNVSQLSDKTAEKMKYSSAANKPLRTIFGQLGRPRLENSIDVWVTAGDGTSFSKTSGLLTTAAYANDANLVLLFGLHI